MECWEFISAEATVINDNNKIHPQGGWRQDLQVKAEEALSCCCTAAVHVWVERSSTALLGWLAGQSGIVKLLKSAVGTDTGRERKRDKERERKRSLSLSISCPLHVRPHTLILSLTVCSLIKPGLWLDQGPCLTHTVWAIQSSTWPLCSIFF